MTHRLKLILHRSHVQGGLTNKEVDGMKGSTIFTDKMFFKLYDLWKIHITNYVKKWKNYKNIYQSTYLNIITPEDELSDIYHFETNHKAKFIDINSTHYILFSTNNNEILCNNKIGRYFRENNHFYLYEITSITETTIEFMIYWIPFHLIGFWYEEYGENGKISIQQMKECINQNNLFNDFDQYYVYK